MQLKDIPVIVALRAVDQAWLENHEIRAEPPVSPLRMLMLRTKAPEKLARAKLESLENKGLVESGTSLDWCWLTEVGRGALADFIAQNGIRGLVL